MSLLDLLATRKADRDPQPARPVAAAAAADPVFSTKALRKFVATLGRREPPVLLDLGPVVGENISFFGEQLGCKIFVEDIFADVERHAREGMMAALPDFFAKRLPQTAGTVDGILCWDLFDYLDRRSAPVLAEQLARVLRPDGVLLGFFGTAQAQDARYTKYVIVDQVNLRYRPYAASRQRQAPLQNRDIIRLFPTLRVSDSFLLQNNVREILFRKPA